MKSYYKSKTLWANFIVIVLALLAYILEPNFPVKLPQASLEVVASIIAVLNIILRFTTKDKLTK